MPARNARKQTKNAEKETRNPKFCEAFLHKTKLCKFFTQGACAKGTNCSFAHMYEELSAPPDLFRTRMCMALIKAGRCKDGNRCKYAHSTSELRTATVPSTISASCAVPDGVMVSISSLVTPQASYSAGPLPPLPSTHSVGPLLSTPNPQCFGTGIASPSHATPYLTPKHQCFATGVISPSHVTPCTHLSFDGNQMGGQMAGQMGSTMASQQMGNPMGNQKESPMSSPMNRGMFFQDSAMPKGSPMKAGMISPSMASTSGRSTSEDELLSFQASARSSRRSSWANESERSFHESSRRPSRECWADVTERSNADSDEQQQDEVDAASDSWSEMFKVKGHCEERQEKTYSAELTPPAPVLPTGPLLTSPEQQSRAAGFASRSPVTPYTCLSYDGSQIRCHMDVQMGSLVCGQLIGGVDGLSVSTTDSPVKRGMFFEEEADTPGNSKAESLFLSKIFKAKDDSVERQVDSVNSKFDLYLPQDTEEQVNHQQNAEEEQEYSYCSTEDYLDEQDERQDLIRDSMLMNFNPEPCSPNKDTFFDLRVGNDPVLHQDGGWRIAVKNSFLDFGCSGEINRLRERRPSF